MSISPSKVIALRPRQSADRSGSSPRATVLHTAPDDDALAELAPVVAALERRSCFRQLVVHAAGKPVGEPPTSASLTAVHRWLGIGIGTPAERTAAALTVLEAIVRNERVELVVISGSDDVALAAALAAAKLGVAVAHLGAGVRSRDWSLPEEVNRVVIDRVSDTLFTHSAGAVEALLAEGVAEGRVHDVGNTRIDLLRRLEDRARRLAAWKKYGAEAQRYTLVALQRRAAVGLADRVERLTGALVDLAAHGVVIVGSTSRAKRALDTAGPSPRLTDAGVRFATDAGYLETLSLRAGAGAIVTDAMSVQEEASALGVPCFTLEPATVSTVTLTHGTNVLLGYDPASIAVARPCMRPPTPAAIALWDGHAAERVADAIVANYAFAPATAQDY